MSDLLCFISTGYTGKACGKCVYGTKCIKHVQVCPCRQKKGKKQGWCEEYRGAPKCKLL